MPRERIQHGRLLIQGDPNAGDADRTGEEYQPGASQPLASWEQIKEQQSLDVTWNRDGGWVQVSISAPPDWFRSAIESQAWKDGDGKEQWPIDMGVYSEALSRAQINHLIRTLRRARDAAFGADE